MRHAVTAVLALAPAATAQPYELPTASTPTGYSGGVAFDIEAAHANDQIVADTFCFRFDAPQGTPMTVFMYYRVGTHAGHTTNQGDWFFIRQWQATSPGPDSTLCLFLAPSYLRMYPNSVPLGVLFYVAGGPKIGYSTIPPASPAYNDGRLRISGGVATPSPPWSGVKVEPAMFTGSIRYNAYPPCFVYANCDFSFVPPALNVNDFVCFNEMFAAGSTGANCDQSTIAPILNANDFICFLNAFARGCTTP
ncbi:MAG: GC-type dockerin domain-anchored protein [Phycisphaerales bacterium]